VVAVGVWAAAGNTALAIAAKTAAAIITPRSRLRDALFAGSCAVRAAVLARPRVRVVLMTIPPLLPESPQPLRPCGTRANAGCLPRGMHALHVVRVASPESGALLMS